MADEISYHEVVAFLTEIEPDYERYLDPIEHKQRLVLAGSGQVAVNDRARGLGIRSTVFGGLSVGGRP